MNEVLMQYFEWYYPSDGSLWKKLTKEAEKLSLLGITAVWIPPACKGEQGKESRGYDIYDFYDLGEFNQKGSIRTRYGTKEELIKMVETLHQNNIQVYADVVFNHLAGADETEKVWVRKMNPDSNTEFISEPFQIEAGTRFTYPGRNKKYSDFTWDHNCFSGVGYAEDLKEEGVFNILNEYGDQWEEVIGDDKPNYDFLMLSDIEYRNQNVREELKKWGKWLHETIPFDGIRLDALKHITPGFIIEWLDYMRQKVNPDLTAVGEYWTSKKVDMMEKYIEETDGRIKLFDAPLHYNFSSASNCDKDFDLRTIFDNTLLSKHPALAVTFVDNHDTQPIQSLESNVQDWFKPLAYALILLRQEGYPCIFYADFYGVKYEDKGRDGNQYKITLPQIRELEKLLELRKTYAYGEQKDYFDHQNCIGWVRSGNEEGAGCVVLISNGENAEKTMEVGKQYAGKNFVDFLHPRSKKVKINEDGTGVFQVKAKSVSVWIMKED